MLNEADMVPDDPREVADALRKAAVPMEIRKNPPKNRMTVVIQLSHEMVRGGGPRGKRIVGNPYLESKDQSYERDFILDDKEPQQLDTGWIGEPGYIAIEVYTPGVVLSIENNGVIIAQVSKDRPLVGNIPTSESTWRMNGADECHFTITAIPR